MTSTDLKAVLAILLRQVPGIGTVDTIRIDPDDQPRKARPGTAYWSLSLGGLSDQLAGFGSGPLVIPVFRTYGFRLEGWLGIKGTEEATETWEVLCERIQNKLQLSQGYPAEIGRVSGVMNFEDPRVTIDVVSAGPDGKTRFHHAVVEASYKVYLRIMDGEG